MKEFSKPMIYYGYRFKRAEQIAAGNYKGYNYFVLNFGTHPTAYIDVTHTSLYKKDYGDIALHCHGGLTYSEPSLLTVDKKGWYIGWDYAHYDDYLCYGYETSINGYGKIWTTPEIVRECKRVINQIIKLEKEVTK